MRSVGELLQNQFRIGLSVSGEGVVKERMTIQDMDVATPQALINIRPVVASILKNSLVVASCLNLWIKLIHWQS